MGARWRGGARLERETRAHPFPSLPISYCASLTQGLGLSRGCQAQLHWVDAAQKVASAWAISGSGKWVRDQETEIATISMAPWGCFAAVEAYTQATLQLTSCSLLRGTLETYASQGLGHFLSATLTFFPNSGTPQHLPAVDVTQVPKRDGFPLPVVPVSVLLALGWPCCPP